MGRIGLVVVCSLVAGCDDGGNKQSDAAIDAAIDVSIDADVQLYPVAPTASTFMWPSLQERFRHSDGSTCTGRVTLAVGDQAVCYAGSGGQVRCAGSIYTHAYGSNFVAIGETNVDAIALSMTFNTATGNNICVHKTDHTMACMGSNTAYGALGTGDTAPTATFVQWPVDDVVRMTGWSDTMCALDGNGEVWCAGLNHTATPTSSSTTGHNSVFIDSSGTLTIDSPDVFRAADGYVCQVHADGLHCMAPGAQALSGTAGAVVDGAAVSAPGGPAMGNPPVCWLQASGEVRCGVSGISQQMFIGAGPILALSGSFYSDTLCAIANDGSLWCKGTNTHGELGFGTTTALTAETRVQPPGSVDLTCQ